MRNLIFFALLPLAAQIPQGWHVSEVNHHGNTKAWTIKDGVWMVTQDRPGNGGILLTDKRYKNFEISLEVLPDWGCDGGLFLRSSEKGEAYQIMLDYLEGGSIGGVYGEGLPELNKALAASPARRADWRKAWKIDDWNKLRVRMTGEVPHIVVWLNDIQILDWTDTKNHAAGGATDGMIALQSHVTNPNQPGGRWVPGGYHRYRNIVIRELP